MTDILPIAGWPNVRQLETNEFATGGANGNMNEQAKSLAARSELLKQYAALPYKSKTGGYALNERVQLATGDIVRSTIPSNVNNPNVDMTGWVKTNSASQIFDESGLSQQEVNNGVESIAALRLLTPKDKGERVYLVSANKDQNEGGGVFVSTQKSGLVDNGGTVVASANPLYFWVRINFETPTFEMFGAKGNDATFDSFDAIQRCVFSCSGASMKAKTYYTSEGIKIPDGFKKLEGISQNTSRIIKTTNHRKAVHDGTLVDYALYTERMHDGDPNTYYKTFANFDVAKADEIFVSTNSYGLYGDRFALSLFKNIRFYKFETGVFANDCWMTTWERVTVHAGDVGFNLRTGTSNVMTACWVIAPTRTAYIFENMLYASMIGCGCDFAGTEGNPADAIISATFSQITVIGMGYEKSHLNKFLYSNGSKISLINVRGLLNENKYTASYGAWIECENRSSIEIISGTFGLKYAKGDRPNVPNALYIAGNSSFNDNNSDLFRVYSTDSLNSYASNVVIEENGYKLEMIGNPLSMNRTIKTNRRIISNNGFSFSENPDDITANGSYYHNFPGPMGYKMMQHIAHGSSTHYGFQFGVTAGESTLANLTARIKNANVWSTPVKILNGDNTTIDSNGFIKAASPIIKLFADKIEPNDEALAQPIIFQKVGTGNYIISGSKGFSSEGWYIEAPQDANGNKLFAVVYTTLENGDISIKTYKKMFDVETASIVADLDKPVDISDGRWIDIRLNEAD